MSQHSSLRIDPTRARHRNVLKRHERIQRLIEMERWKDRSSALGLPKVKSLKIKVKKVKAEKAEGEAAKPGQAPTTPTTPVAAAPAAAATEKKKPQASAAKK